MRKEKKIKVRPSTTLVCRHQSPLTPPRPLPTLLDLRHQQLNSHDQLRTTPTSPDLWQWCLDHRAPPRTVSTSTEMVRQRLKPPDLHRPRLNPSYLATSCTNLTRFVSPIPKSPPFRRAWLHPQLICNGDVWHPLSCAPMPKTPRSAAPAPNLNRSVSVTLDVHLSLCAYARNSPVCCARPQPQPIRISDGWLPPLWHTRL